MSSSPPLISVKTRGNPSVYQLHGRLMVRPSSAVSRTTKFVSGLSLLENSRGQEFDMHE
jgi:hypothetical protein